MTDRELWRGEWCDWRYRIEGCRDSDLWRAVYIAHSVFSGLVCIATLYVCYHKIYLDVWRKNLTIFEISEGALKARPTEVFLLSANIHILLRFLHTTAILGNWYSSDVAREVSFEVAWPLLLWACLGFPIGLVFATPKSYIRETGHSVGDIIHVKLPPAYVLNGIWLALIGMPTITLPVTAALDGLARDNGNYSLAVTLNRVHYYQWAFFCVAGVPLLCYFSLKMIHVLTVNVVGVQDVEQNKGFRKLIRHVLINFVLMGLMSSMFALVLLMFAIFRVEILSHKEWSVLFALAWNFASPLTLIPILYVTGKAAHRKRLAETGGASPQWIKPKPMRGAASTLAPSMLPALSVGPRKLMESSLFSTGTKKQASGDLDGVLTSDNPLVTGDN
ncbi:hypothetical protein BC832DRAFT_592862 [Gaertneriomyces semiglobifer]|nr:hypothetical protein BC832DRAFT_592862 [Gaertneriomyces semiglobifer]